MEVRYGKRNAWLHSIRVHHAKRAGGIFSQFIAHNALLCVFTRVFSTKLNIKSIATIPRFGFSFGNVLVALIEE